jgi:hypothetical protein
MIAFRIKLNGRRFATAGLPGHHVVSAIATSVVRKPEVVKLARPRRLEHQELRFELGGLWTSPDGAQEHVSWTKIQALKPGDKLSIEVVKTDRPDEPIHRSRTEAPSLEDSERKYLRHLLKKYGRAPKPRPGRRHNKALQTDGASRRR